MTSFLVDHLTVFALQKWAIKKIEKLRRAFLWKGVAIVNGSHCLVQWAKARRLEKFGGLGILALKLLAGHFVSDGCGMNDRC
jgi:hypothetical protein